jgi:hypothetical protein
VRFSAKSGAILAALTMLMLTGCWGGGDAATTEVTHSPGQKIKPTENKWTRVVPLSPRQKIAQTGNRWAPLFAAGDYRAACKYQTYSLCSVTTCEHVGGPEARPKPIQNCAPLPPSLRKSFAGATVQDVAIEGGRAGAKLSNGKVVEFLGRQPVPCIGSACPRPIPDAWLVHRLGSSSGKKYFEP